jgi:hypothetical protein
MPAAMPVCLPTSPSPLYAACAQRRTQTHLRDGWVWQPVHRLLQALALLVAEEPATVVVADCDPWTDDVAALLCAHHARMRPPRPSTARPP